MDNWTFENDADKVVYKRNNLDFSGVPVVETSPFSAGDVGFIPCLLAKAIYSQQIQ